jgi:hypothetical protein
VKESARAQHRRGEARFSSARLDQQARFLDAQAALPAAAPSAGAGARRDYAALAGLAGHQRVDYERLAPREQRAARLEIDRELAMRKELMASANDLADTLTPRLGRRESRKAERAFEGELRQRMRDAGQRPPASGGQRSSLDAWRREGRAERSSVMSDAREVAARRKRQLGKGRR